jgi:hypothetical protein
MLSHIAADHSTSPEWTPHPRQLSPPAVKRTVRWKMHTQTQSVDGAGWKQTSPANQMGLYAGAHESLLYHWFSGIVVVPLTRTGPVQRPQVIINSLQALSLRAKILHIYIHHPPLTTPSAILPTLSAT